MSRASVTYADDGAALTATAGERLLFRYVYATDALPADHAPRPYFHPINTLAGETLTAIQPHDHPWHYGLSLAVPYIDGVNFWGGPTYVHDQGYVPLPNHGRVVHCDWSKTVERLRWLGAYPLVLLEEQRQIAADVLSDSHWCLRLTFTLRNVTGWRLTFASPAAHGRAGAGYGGLFWRGTPAQRRWHTLSQGRAGEADVHGALSPSLALVDPASGTHIVFTSTPACALHPTRWFVRQSEYPGVCAALAFDAPLVLERDAVLALHYAIHIQSPPQG